jgi:hypothetical protein
MSGLRGIFPLLRGLYKSLNDVLKAETNAANCSNVYMLRNIGRNSRNLSNPFHSTNCFSYHKRWHTFGRAFPLFEQTPVYRWDQSAERLILLGFVYSISRRNCYSALLRIINRTSCTFKLIPTMLLLSSFAQKRCHVLCFGVRINISLEDKLSTQYPCNVCFVAVIWTLTIPLHTVTGSKMCG